VHFRDTGFPISIAVNVSARQFANPQLVAEMHGALLRHGTDPHAMEIEITESWTMRDPQSATRTLGALRDLGVRVAIDDFGIGHSSLGYLKHFPIDIIKIDQLFVRGLPDEQSDAAIARAIIALATSIGCETRAEGIESSDQAVWLAAAGCHTAQGFLFSPALSTGEIDGWLAARRSSKDRTR
jgi:EAL domain-containing protein (putative c-di-GMP-specific phosphodiesterase class I)